MLKLRDWVNIKEYDGLLSLNSNAIALLEKNQDKINWKMLSGNPSALNLLEQNPNKINWDQLSLNPNALNLLVANPDRIDWNALLFNPSIFEINKPQYKTDITEKANIIDDILYKN